MKGGMLAPINIHPAPCTVIRLYLARVHLTVIRVGYGLFTGDPTCVMGSGANSDLGVLVGSGSGF